MSSTSFPLSPSSESKKIVNRNKKIRAAQKLGQEGVPSYSQFSCGASEGFSLLLDEQSWERGTAPSVVPEKVST